MKQHTTIILTIILMASQFCLTTYSQVQEQASDNAITPAIQLSPEQLSQISEDMSEYIDEVEEVEGLISSATTEDIKSLERRMQSIDVRWQTYIQIEQVDIASSPSLMELLSQYKLYYIATNDSLTAQKSRLEAFSTFGKTMRFFSECESKYNNLSTMALQYSLAPQTATQLADVKAQEALLYAQIQNLYQKAVEASQVSEDVKAKMPELEQRYIKLTTLSEKIQATAYKPWIERIKDYILSLAGIAIILIFINFVVTKLKTIKQAREVAKKYSNMLNPNEDYPTI